MVKVKRNRANWNPTARPLEWVAGLGVLAILAVLAAILFRMHRASTPVVDAGVPIRFVGVRPDLGDAIYDAQGRFLRDDFYALPDLKPWASNDMPRNFIFQIDATNVGEVFPRFSYNLPGHAGTRARVKTCEVYRLPDGTTRIEAPVLIFSTHLRTFLHFIQRRVPVDRLDCRLDFYMEHARDHEAVLRGPFSGPRELVLSNQTTLRVDGATNEEESATELTLTWTAPAGQPAPFVPETILIRDVRGNLAPSNNRRLSDQGRTKIETRQYADLKLSEIGEIIVPRAQSIQIPNVTVRYPDLPDRHIPPAWEKVGHILKTGGDSSAVRQLRLHDYDRQTILELLEVARGPHIYQLHSTLQTMLADSAEDAGLAAWGAPEAARLRATIRSWSQASHPRVRLSGAALGLQAGWAEFLDPAMTLLVSGKPEYRAQIANALRESARLLSPQHLETIRRLIRESDAVFTSQTLAECLALNGTRTAAETLLSLSADSRPWIWWPVIQACPPSFWSDREPLPDPIRKHLILAKGPDAETTTTSLREACEELPEQMSVALRLHHPHIFMFLLKNRVDVPPWDRDVATRFVIEHLRSYPWPDREAYITWTMLQRLNAWHGTTFGQEAARDNPEVLPALNEIRWTELVEEVLAWHRSAGC